MRFVAIDLETANPRMSSVCQIGVVTFENGKEIEAEAFLIDPEDYFDPYCIDVHGINEAHVHGAPTFSQIHHLLTDRTAGQVVVCHSHFDRVALSQACTRYELVPFSCEWLDTAKVARRAWEQFAKKGYGLANLAKHFGIEFQHHDALHDARTAGLILLRAIEESGLSLKDWQSKCSDGLHVHVPIRREGDGDGPLVGESIVFTGSLQMSRREAADQANEAGAAVEPGVTKKTTLLVVGDQDLDKLNGQSKSSKHRKAEGLIRSGQPIRILGEADYMSAIAQA